MPFNPLVLPTGVNSNSPASVSAAINAAFNSLSPAALSGDGSALNVLPAGGTEASLASLLSGAAAVPGFGVDGALVIGAGLPDAATLHFQGTTFYIQTEGGASAITYSAPLHYFVGPVDVTGTLSPNYIAQTITEASPAGASVLSYWSRTTNTSASNSGNAVRLDYSTSNVNPASNYDTTLAVYSAPQGLSTGGNQYLGLYVCAQSPYDSGTTGQGGSFACEMDQANLGRDLGWAASRAASLWWAGVLQLVPAAGYMGALEGGGRDLLFGLCLARGAESSTTGTYVTAHNAILIEANHTAAVDGRGIYIGGDAIGGLSPYCPIEMGNAWLHGMRFDNATFADNQAITLAAGQQIAYGGASGCVDFAGSGAPATAAPIGSTYRNTSGEAGSTFYINRTGLSSGWYAVA